MRPERPLDGVGLSRPTSAARPQPGRTRAKPSWAGYWNDLIGYLGYRICITLPSSLTTGCAYVSNKSLLVFAIIVRPRTNKSSFWGWVVVRVKADLLWCGWCQQQARSAISSPAVPSRPPGHYGSRSIFGPSLSLPRHDGGGARSCSYADSENTGAC